MMYYIFYEVKWSCFSWLNQNKYLEKNNNKYFVLFNVLFPQSDKQKSNRFD